MHYRPICLQIQIPAYLNQTASHPCLVPTSEAGSIEVGSGQNVSQQP